jgi:hypothetical protein
MHNYSMAVFAVDLKLVRSVQRLKSEKGTRIAITTTNDNVKYFYNLIKD